jgi:hypothetical protein
MVRYTKPLCRFNDRSERHLADDDPTLTFGSSASGTHRAIVLHYAALLTVAKHVRAVMPECRSYPWRFSEPQTCSLHDDFILRILVSGGGGTRRPHDLHGTARSMGTGPVTGSGHGAAGIFSLRRMVSRRSQNPGIPCLHVRLCPDPEFSSTDTRSPCVPLSPARTRRSARTRRRRRSQREDLRTQQGTKPPPKNSPLGS